MRNKREDTSFLDSYINTILCGDALEMLKNFPDESISCCITSPPYYGLRDYKSDGQIGREKTVEEYLDRLVQVFRQVRRVLKKDGTCFIVIGDSYAGSGGGKGQYMDPKYPKGRNGQNPSITQKVLGYKAKDLMGIPWRLALLLREDGWYLRSDIIWHKENAMPEACRDRPTRSYEHVFLLSKSPRYYYDFDAMAEPIKEVSKKRYMRGRSAYNKYLNEDAGIGVQKINKARKYGEYKGDNIPQFRNKRDIWTINTVSFRGEHYAAFPPKLAEICMIAGSPKGGIILDPFIGSGTVGFVALMQDRKYIGIELNEDYVNLAKKRISEEVKKFNEEQKQEVQEE
ncbi:site-specific DNA-methyltransferase [Fusobacterium necrophorum]|uniref:DNA-methyltransferase n=1 Tax=Fusobacterium necrophorum TaxID=859 RepID=UPI00088E7F36|nr:site-specific DNA-methyltransferase [Fusobacterium necrophorum]AYZ74208.1 site-specific DNA-methyltransferase [Fusobacterium necrophorum]AZW09910.1 site-specific DNA-methyltransferase [Fusobacterium necrophorum subsp. necrophorum]SDB02232.1 DNA modification methylase [Fusobacterium necrophorum]SQD08647.1 DNA adenine methyltransferase YhdJ [Fusobacterium necrophorum subsp. necrophorum]